MSRLNLVEPNQATGKAAELLNAVKSKLGIVPNLTKVMANQPAVLDTYLVIGGALSGGAFDAKTREAIRSFQKDQGMEADGFADSSVLNALRKAAQS